MPRLQRSHQVPAILSSTSFTPGPPPFPHFSRRHVFPEPSTHTHSHTQRTSRCWRFEANYGIKTEPFSLLYQIHCLKSCVISNLERRNLPLIQTPNHTACDAHCFHMSASPWSEWDCQGSWEEKQVSRVFWWPAGLSEWAHHLV